MICCSAVCKQIINTTAVAGSRHAQILTLRSVLNIAQANNKTSETQEQRLLLLFEVKHPPTLT